MHFKATDVFDYYKPSRCVRRVALKAAGVEPQETDTPFLELLRKLGVRHESGHLQTLSGVLDLSGLDQEERAARRSVTLLATPGLGSRSRPRQESCRWFSRGVKNGSYQEGDRKGSRPDSG